MLKSAKMILWVLSLFAGISIAFLPFAISGSADKVYQCKFCRTVIEKSSIPASTGCPVKKNHSWHKL